MKSDIKVEVVKRWKGKGMREVREIVNIKKKWVNDKKNYRKIGKKNDNDLDVDVARLECSNNKCYAPTFRYIDDCNYLLLIRWKLYMCSAIIACLAHPLEWKHDRIVHSNVII